MLTDSTHAASAAEWRDFRLALFAQWSGIPQYLWKKMRGQVNVQRLGFEDFEQVGAMALWEAAQKFDLSRGFRFNTFSISWCWGRLMAASQHTTMIYFPNSAMGREAEQQHRCLALESLGQDTDFAGGSYAPTAPEEPEPTTDNEAIAAALQKLRPRLARIARMRWMEGYTLNEVGRQENISKERVRQLERVARAYLAEYLEATP